LGAIELALVHGVGDRVSSLQLAFLRSLGSGLLLAVVVLISKRPLIVRSNNIKVQLVRGFFSATGLWALIYTFAHMPLIDATALSYTRAFFMTIFAALILHEDVRWARWLGTATGLLGAALIIQPGFSNPNIVYFVGIAAPALNAAMQVSTKFAVKLDAVNTTMFWVFSISLVLFSPAIATAWEWPSGEIVIYVVLIAIFGPLATYMSLWAMRFADVSTLAPFDYTRLIINALIALILFREMPTLYSWLGMAIIVGGCLVQTTQAGLRNSTVSLIAPRADR
jgi:drug/metabolite transporter (DMT)-like permease